MEKEATTTKHTNEYRKILGQPDEVKDTKPVSNRKGKGKRG
jgi:hypothetical protein